MFGDTSESVSEVNCSRFLYLTYKKLLTIKDNNYEETIIICNAVSANDG